MLLTHQIAGITIRTESDTLRPYLEQNPFKQFRVGNTEPEVCFRFRTVDPGSLTMPPLSRQEIERLSYCLYYPHEGWKSSLLRSPMVRARLQACLNQPEQVSLELRHSTVTFFDFARRRLDFFYTPDQGETLANCYVGPSILAPFLPTFSAAMVHCSGLVRNHAAALFLAPDEGGKTTVVRQSTTGTVLCDDQIILRKEGDVFMTHGTPWGLMTSTSQQTRVGAFFLLEQAKRFELMPIKPVAALDYLWNEHLGYRIFLPRKLRIRAFEILSEVCHQAPVYRMRFPKDYVDWDAIDAALVT
ncbi:MAG: hypothetical protein WBE46_00165 [Dehalococcoidia bacterium]